MSAQVHNLTQGSQEWHEHRMQCFNASDAAAMLGVSPYKSRDALLQEKATGNVTPVDAATQRIFDKGHEFERMARPYAEEIIGEELFSPTLSIDIDSMRLSASFDGLTMLDDVAWEHKSLNEKLRENLAIGVIPDEYKPQLEQQLLVSGAEKVLFMASAGMMDWQDECLFAWYESDELLRKRLINGWKQFAEDLKNWKPKEIAVQPEAKEPDALPALVVRIEGGVSASNLGEYKTTALAFIRSINTDLQTDQDFADAAKLVTFCDKTEKELEQVKKAALEQTADIAELFDTIDTLKDEMRSKRLELNKLVKERKACIKAAIATEAHAEYANFINEVNAKIDDTTCHIVSPSLNLEEAMKNKRTVESLRNAVNTELARCKILVSEQTDLIRSNYDALQEIAGEHGFLFNDIQEIIRKDREDLLNLAKQRIADYQAEQEAARQRELEKERERIRKEEEARARAEQEAAAKAEAKPVPSNSHQEEKPNASIKKLYGVEDQEHLYCTDPEEAAEDYYSGLSKEDLPAKIEILEYEKKELEFSGRYHFDNIMESLDDENAFYEQAPTTPHPKIVEAWKSFVDAVKEHYEVTLYEPNGKKFLFQCDTEELVTMQQEC